MTDRQLAAMETCVAIGRIACATAMLPNNVAPAMYWLHTVHNTATLSQAASSVKQVRYARQQVAIFLQTAANFRQRRLWVLKISILPLNFPKIGKFQSTLHFWTKIFGQKRK